MYEWKTFSRLSKGQKTKELLSELVRMWQQAGKSRAGAIHQASEDLGLSSRKGKCILYDEPHTLTDVEALGVESRAESAWLRIADTARQTAEYCEAQAELSRIRKRQGDLFDRGVGWSKSIRSSRKPAAASHSNVRASRAPSQASGSGLSALLYAAPIALLCGALIG